MRRTSIGVIVALSLTLLSGCERFEASTQAQCEAALKNALSVRLGTAPEAKPAEGKKTGFLDKVKRSVKKGASGVAFSAFKLTDDYKRLLKTCQSDWSVHVTQCLTAGKDQAAFKECKNWPWDAEPIEAPKQK